MKKLSYIGATLTVIGFSLLPANAVKNQTYNNINITDATEQITQSTEPQSCWYDPNNPPTFVTCE